MIFNYKVDIPIKSNTPSHVILPLISFCFCSIPQTINKACEVRLNFDVVILWHVKILSISKTQDIKSAN